MNSELMKTKQKASKVPPLVFTFENEELILGMFGKLINNNTKMLEESRKNVQILGDIAVSMRDISVAMNIIANHTAEKRDEKLPETTGV